jgi:hypothetical protein
MRSSGSNWKSLLYFKLHLDQLFNEFLCCPEVQGDGWTEAFAVRLIIHLQLNLKAFRTLHICLKKFDAKKLFIIRLTLMRFAYSVSPKDRVIRIGQSSLLF